MGYRYQFKNPPCYCNHTGQAASLPCVADYIRSGAPLVTFSVIRPIPSALEFHQISGVSARGLYRRKRISLCPEDICMIVLQRVAVGAFGKAKGFHFLNVDVKDFENGVFGCVVDALNWWVLVQRTGFERQIFNKNHFAV